MRAKKKSTPAIGYALFWWLTRKYSELRKRVRIFALWWTIRDSNSRPLRCERSALPTELIARIFTFLPIKAIRTNSTKQRRMGTAFCAASAPKLSYKPEYMLSRKVFWPNSTEQGRRRLLSALLATALIAQMSTFCKQFTDQTELYSFNSLNYPWQLLIITVE